MRERYEFVPLRSAGLPLIGRWTAAPHVAEWWPDGASEIALVLDECADAERAGEEPETRAYIVHLDDRPIAYLQCWRDPSGKRGVDQFIGEAGLLGQGHGSAFVRQFCDRLFAEGVPAVTIDPDPSNTRAVRTYLKAGFRPVGPMDTRWGPVLLMQRDNAQ
jgi:aminoglycoside 6'-N-acetyltransferase